MGNYADRPGSMTGKVAKSKAKRAADDAALIARRDAGTLTQKDKERYLLNKALKESTDPNVVATKKAISKKVDEGLAHEQRLDMGEAKRKATQAASDAEMGLSVNADGSRNNPWKRHAPVAEAAPAAPAAPVRYATGLLPPPAGGYQSIPAAPMRAPGGPPGLAAGAPEMATGQQINGGAPMAVSRAPRPPMNFGQGARPAVPAAPMMGPTGAPMVPGGPMAPKAGLQARTTPMPSLIAGASVGARRQGFAKPMMGRRGGMAVPGTPVGPGTMAGYQGAPAAPAMGRMANPQRRINQGEFSGVSVSPKGGRRR